MNLTHNRLADAIIILVGTCTIASQKMANASLASQPTYLSEEFDGSQHHRVFLCSHHWSEQFSSTL